MNKLVLAWGLILLTLTSAEAAVEQTYWPNGATKRLTTIGPVSETIKTYYANGQLAHVHTMREGTYVGTVKDFDAKGKLVTEEHYANGKLHGKNIYNAYSEYGELRTIIEERYVHGVLRRKTELNARREIQKEEKFFPNGELDN